MKTLHYLLLIAHLLIIFSCKKKVETYEGLSLKLDVNDFTLQWNEINSKDFIRYDVYRSDSKIELDTKSNTISGQKIFSTTKARTTEFYDSLNFISDKVHYRVFGYFKSSIVASEDYEYQANVYFFPGKLAKPLLFKDGSVMLISSVEFNLMYYFSLENKKLISSMQHNFQFPSISTPPIYAAYHNSKKVILQDRNESFMNIYDDKIQNINTLNLPIGNSFSQKNVTFENNLFSLISTNQNQSILVSDMNTLQSVATYPVSLNLWTSKLEISPLSRQLHLFKQDSLIRFTINSDGTLTQNAALSYPGGQLNVQENNPVVSPDGKYIIAGTFLFDSNFNYISNLIRDNIFANDYEFAFTNNSNQITSIWILPNKSHPLIRVYNLKGDLIKEKYAPLPNSTNSRPSILEFNDDVYLMGSTIEPKLLENYMYILKLSH